MERKALRCLRWGILFTFLDFFIAGWNLLPSFAGMGLFYASIQSQRLQTQSEDRVKPLFLVLAVDYFLHWLWHFENGLESLLVYVIYLYAVFVLMGEVAGRIRADQPKHARQLDLMRIAAVLLQSFTFLTSPYGIEALNLLTVAADIGLCIAFMRVTWKIQPVEA